MPELSTSSPRPAGVRERRRRAEALRAHRADARAQSMAAAGELAYLRAQLTLAARLTARLAATHDVDELVRIVVQELHGTFAFYLAAIQRLDDDGVLRLVVGSGALAEVMTEFLLVEQSVRHGINGRVARTATSALVSDTRADADYIVRDPHTDPRSELSVPIVVDGSVWGVLNIEAAEPDAFGEADVVLVETIAASLGSAIHRAGLVADLERTFTTTLSALMSTVEAKDDYTASHEEDVAGLSERVALRMGLSPAHARDVRYAALLHDVGKVAVPSEILLKPGPLNEAEWVAMRRHTVVGGELVARIEAFAHLAPAVRASHERWDGDGYPDGMAGEDIPLAARIIAACDTYDAIVTDRPYRPARTPEQAREELRGVAGIQLDARVVEALLEELSELA
ncbi:MAG TPA: HD domain-containing phosphohydrolase [Solirubrobacteraceae bacterium]|jgi:HD-GYP domain-containing protein (c-di-GMP phosphodiesterase class II)|nr:HD domain-containing phosphohydrolase [Solirubrobacteraceae bacterium]